VAGLPAPERSARRDVLHVVRTQALRLPGAGYPSWDCRARTAGVHAVAGWFPVILQIAAVM
jgi:hypothetical protein